MERIVNLLFGILNWHENTTVRKHDPKEIKDLKRCERRAVGSFLLTILLAAIYVWLVDQIPTQGSPFVLALTPVFSYITEGLAFASATMAAISIYYLGKGIYCYVTLDQ